MFERIYNVFSADARLQAAIVDRTRYIKSEFRKIVEAEFKDKEINSATAMEFLTFINLLNQKQLERYNQTIFLKKPCCHYFSNFLNGCFWLLLSLLSASLVFPINVQNGFEGVNVLFGLFKHSLATLTHFYKIMIGILPGLTNSFFYLISTLNCHYTLLNLQDSLSRDHSVSAIIKLLSVLIIAVSAAIGYITISKSVTENSNNIFAIQVKSIWSEIINYGNGIAMFLVSLNNLENAIVSTKPFKKSYNDYMRFLDRKNLTKENISVLRQYSYFKKPSFEHKYSDNLNKNQLSLSYH